MNFTFHGFVCGLLIVLLIHLLVICEEILLKMQEIIFLYKYFIVYDVDFSVAARLNNAKILKILNLK